MRDATMIAWARDAYGAADGMGQETVRVPKPGRGEVRVRVRATALNAGDIRIMRGDPLLMRLFFGLRRPKQPIRGLDVAGTVVAVGEGGDEGSIGEEVVVELSGGGGLAPFAIARADRTVARPESLAPEIAATVPISGGTAVQALDVARVESGQRVLVLGASGGVGTFTVQLAALRGAEVWATCGAPNRSLIESLGAARTFDYRATALSEIPASFDAIIDIAGTAPLRVLKRMLTPSGTVAMVAGDGGRVLGPIPRIVRALFVSLGSRRSIRPVAAMAKPDINRQLLSWVAEGRIAPVIERILPWEAAGQALARVDSGRTVGKVIVLGTE
jgi:NADPH:quinone reductase-like Zn-dependent oxidoreductase